MNHALVKTDRTKRGENSQQAKTQIALLTVAGNTHYNRDYAQKCIASWHRIQGVSGAYRMVSNGLRTEDVERAEGQGFMVYDRHPPEVVEALADKPGLRTMREVHPPTWRHVIDSLILCRDAEYVLLIDTDVFVVEPVAFPNENLDFLYSGDDIPGFRGKWYLPFFEPMVPTMNPGFFLFRPAAVDLDQLEHLVQRYFVNAKNYWWTRQSALAVLVGRSSARAAFDGNDVRVFSGNKKRTPQQIRDNHWKYFGSSRLTNDAEYVRQCLDGAAVIHFAGAGKKWLGISEASARDDGPPRLLRTVPAPNATPVQRGLIAARMAAIQTPLKRMLQNRRRQRNQTKQNR